MIFNSKFFALFLGRALNQFLRWRVIRSLRLIQILFLDFLLEHIFLLTLDTLLFLKDCWRVFEKKQLE